MYVCYVIYLYVGKRRQISWLKIQNTAPLTHGEQLRHERWKDKGSDKSAVIKSLRKSCKRKRMRESAAALRYPTI